jgi:phosphoglycolate phosphatase-like HAD superfamily hydrolase
MTVTGEDHGDLLVLFDIDGTMLLDDSYSHGRAMVEAMRSTYGAAMADDAVLRTEPWGKTDPQIAREALTMAGFGEDEIEEGRVAWIKKAEEVFVADRTARDWILRPGLATTLDRLRARGMRLGLLTGNLHGIAVTKIERMGLAGIFDLHAGAYGDDAEARTELVPIARGRAGSLRVPWPRERTVVIGDTPGDIATAQADRVASVMLASQRYPRAALASADAVVSNVDELLRTLEAWSSQHPHE